MYIYKCLLVFPVVGIFGFVAWLVHTRFGKDSSYREYSDYSRWERLDSAGNYELQDYDQLGRYCLFQRHCDLPLRKLYRRRLRKNETKMRLVRIGSTQEYYCEVCGERFPYYTAID